MCRHIRSAHRPAVPRSVRDIGGARMSVLVRRTTYALRQLQFDVPKTRDCSCYGYVCMLHVVLSYRSPRMQPRSTIALAAAAVALALGLAACSYSRTDPNGLVQVDVL